jgi:ATP-dependent helicase/nuclease subunit B
VAEAVAAFLDDAAVNIDLRATWIIVPTRQSARRLREALTVRAAARCQAVLGARLLTPESLLAALVEPAAAPAAANAWDVRIAWQAVLAELAADACPDLLPEARPDDPYWRRTLAAGLRQLRRLLGENGLDCAAVARSGHAREEAGRWRDLAELEQRFRAVLRASGLRDRDDLRAATALRPAWPPELRRIVLAATPDPLPLILHALAARPATLSLDVLIAAPPEEADAFDAWGRPVASWTSRPLPLAATALHSAANSQAQARAIASALARLASTAGTVAIAVGAPASTALLGETLATAGIASHEPAGRPLRDCEWLRWLALLQRFGEQPAFATLQQLVRLPLSTAALCKACAAPPESIFGELDAFASQHLPGDLHAARHLPASALVTRVLDTLAGWRRQVRDGGLPALRELLNQAAAARLDGLDPAVAAQRRGEAEKLAVHLDAAAAAASRHRIQDIHTILEWLVEIAGAEMLYAAPDPAAIPLQGWLEMLWEPAPALVLADFADGMVPAHVRGDLFLPDRLRTRLGLRDNAVRHARDAYLFTALQACRPAGAVAVWVPRTDAAGEPLKPSRLLLQVAEAELPARIRHLFRDIDPEPPAPAASLAWRWRIPVVPPPARLRVTAFRDYLDCPFRFYLRHVLGWRDTVEPDPDELDALGFGDLAHSVLQQFGRDPGLADCADAGQLREALRDLLATEARRRFGAGPSLALSLQLDSLGERLGTFAGAQASHRADGWRILACEQVLGELGDPGLALPVSGRIDRIDQHEQRGDLLLLDYKTGDNAANPVDTHRAGLPRDPAEQPLAWALWPGERHRWRDLQLPLYAIVAESHYNRPALPGYFNLPRNLDGVGIAAFAEWTPQLAASARACATGVAEAVRAGAFWPPRRKPAHDDYAAWFMGRAPAETVVWGRDLRDLRDLRDVRDG